MTRLPRALSFRQDEARRSLRKWPGELAGPRTRSMAHVLVVDDDVPVTRSIARVLARRGHEVRVAHSGSEALGMLAGVEVLLTDARMPGMSGVELVGRARVLRPGLPCCIMSGDGEAGHADSNGVDAEISKPFDQGALVEMVESLATGTRTAPATPRK